MLFSSFEFIFGFLPVTLLVFWLIVRSKNANAAVIWLVIASLFFYGWWNPAYLLLLLASLFGNFLFSAGIRRTQGYKRSLLLICGVVFNLALLGYFKYANFFVDNVNLAFNSAYHLEQIILPLAISFFTFQQIAYLADSYRDIVEPHSFLNYCLFVTFFPQLIAGPIVHHAETMPQFKKRRFLTNNYSDLTIGVTIFVIGLVKKVVIADGLAPYANSVFDATDAGAFVSLFEAWLGTLAYTLQLYFDFSGYSDMAIGLARMFGIRLPENFSSPLKSTSIIEFWRRWHITLSRFINHYLYLPMSMKMTRFAMRRRYSHWSNFTVSVAGPALIAFILAGIWHGAGWNFVIFGLLHGSYLVLNHGWRLARKLYFKKLMSGTLLGTWFARLLTLVAVMISMVFFRSTTFDGAVHITAAMFGWNGLSLPSQMATRLGDFATTLEALGVTFAGFQLISRYSISAGFVVMIALLVCCWTFPSTQQILRNYRSILGKTDAVNSRLSEALRWRPSWPLAVTTGALFYIAVMHLTRKIEFLYFNF